MPIKGYSSVEEVAGLVGMEFDSTEEDQVLRLIEAAESFVDWATDRSTWGSNIPIVDEYYELSGSRLYLKSAPVTSVESIKAGWYNNVALLNDLVAPTDYQLVSPKDGLVMLSSLIWTTYLGYNYLHVSYTPELLLPAHLKLATTQLVAHWLSIHFDPARLSYSLYTLGDGDLSSRPINCIPQEIMELLDTFRQGGIVFA